MDKASKAKAFSFVYNNPLLRYIQNWGHIVSETYIRGGLILDLGSGTNEHAAFANAGSKYVSLDRDGDVLRIGRETTPGQISVQSLAQNLPFATATFDGVISIYNFEHLARLEECVVEVARVLKPGRILAVTIPTEGFLFRLGRRWVTAPFAVKNLGFKTVDDYESYMRGEHINSVERVCGALSKHFRLEKIDWFPFIVPGKNLNMVLAIKCTRL